MEYLFAGKAGNTCGKKFQQFHPLPSRFQKSHPVPARVPLRRPAAGKAGGNGIPCTSLWVGKTCGLEGKFKTILYYFTGQSEFERAISDGKLSDYDKILRLEASLTDSTSLNFVLKESPDSIDWVIGKILEKEFGIDQKTLIVENRRIEGKKNKRLGILRRYLEQYLAQILGYEQLKALWTVLRPDQLLNARISPQWASELGFQGNDPATDFRGMGILGLEQLLYFSRRYNKIAVKIMEKSKNQEKGYPFAIVGISMTALARDLLNSNILKRYFVTIRACRLQIGPNVEDFHEFYCRIFYLFDELWYESEPESIMQYVPLRNRFRDDLITKLGTDEGVNDMWKLFI
uniref:ELMO domain-containing protein n=1 Tax=Romanomermis culicivorax TaxID=13658 RepID=A0A915KWZ9_ROMCU